MLYDDPYYDFSLMTVLDEVYLHPVLYDENYINTISGVQTAMFIMTKLSDIDHYELSTEDFQRCFDTFAEKFQTHVNARREISEYIAELERGETGSNSQSNSLDG